MMNKKEIDFDVSASEKIGLGLLNSHVHFLTGEINEDNIEDTIKWIIYENIISGQTPRTLTLYINSTGGSLNDSLGLIDIMKASKCPIATRGLGSICSAAFMIFQLVTKVRDTLQKILVSCATNIVMALKVNTTISNLVSKKLSLLMQE